MGPTLPAWDVLIRLGNVQKTAAGFCFAGINAWIFIAGTVRVNMDRVSVKLCSFIRFFV
jgi:hypothetical protein